MSAIVCSAAARTLPLGALTTAMPRAVAASMSMLSTPIPARPTTRSRRCPPQADRGVMAVPERVMMASYSPISPSNSAGDIPSLTSTSNSPLQIIDPCFVQRLGNKYLHALAPFACWQFSVFSCRVRSVSITDNSQTEQPG